MIAIEPEQKWGVYRYTYDESEGIVIEQTRRKVGATLCDKSTANWIASHQTRAAGEQDKPYVYRVETETD